MDLAVFDLDGTITRRDTLMQYILQRLVRRPWWLLRLVAVLPAALAYLFGARDRGALKSALIRCTLGGHSRADIDGHTRAFVPRLLASGLRADALVAIARHREAGDCLVLMSASPDLYVPAIGQALGFNETICTQVAWRGDVLLGALASPNCRGEEKLRALAALRARHVGRRATAYGNARSDIAHLRSADRGVLVNGSRAARATAAALHIERVAWR